MAVQMERSLDSQETPTQQDMEVTDDHELQRQNNNDWEVQLRPPPTNGDAKQVPAIHGIHGSTLELCSDGKDARRRQMWDTDMEGLMTNVGYVTGMVNVTRFPYLCHKHGGLTFMILYLLLMTIMGLPLIFLELSIGQFCSQGPVPLFSGLSPVTKGLGYGMVLKSAFTAIFYSITIAWTMHYAFSSIQSPLPWTYCDEDSPLTCFHPDQDLACRTIDNRTTYWNNSCTNIKEVCQFYNYSKTETRDDFGRFQCRNSTTPFSITSFIKTRHPANEYFMTRFLGLDETSTWSNMGGFKWDLVLCLVASWCLIGLCFIKGVRSYGKVSTFLPIFSYLSLILVFFRFASMDGAAEGIASFINPKKLHGFGDFLTWGDAAFAVWHSVGPSYGGIITLASCNRFKNNIQKDAVIIAFSNVITSVFSGFVIYSIVGVYAHQTNVDIESIRASSAAIPFEIFAKAVGAVPGASFWSFLFFISLMCLSLAPRLVQVFTIISAITDQWPGLHNHSAKVVTGVSIVGFILSLSLSSRGGIFLYRLTHLIGWPVLIFSFLELLMLLYVHRGTGLLVNVVQMGSRMTTALKVYWLSTWVSTMSVLLPLMFLFKAYTYIPITGYPPDGLGFLGWFGGMRFWTSPWEIQILGWFMALLPVLVIPAVPIIQWAIRERKIVNWGSVTLSTKREFSREENNDNT